MLYRCPWLKKPKSSTYVCTWSKNLLNSWLEDNGVCDLVVIVLSTSAAPLPPGNSQGHDTALAAAKVIQSYNSTKGRRGFTHKYSIFHPKTQVTPETPKIIFIKVQEQARVLVLLQETQVLLLHAVFQLRDSKFLTLVLSPIFFQI